MPIPIFNKLTCKHRDASWVRDIHGDQITIHNYHRSVWHCHDCNKTVYRNEPHMPEIQRQAENVWLHEVSARGRWRCTADEWHEYGKRLNAYIAKYGTPFINMIPAQMVQAQKPRSIKDMPQEFRDGLRAAIESGEVHITGDPVYALKDHEIAELVNDLTHIGKNYGPTQQLRAHVSHRVYEFLNLLGLRKMP